MVSIFSCLLRQGHISHCNLHQCGGLQSIYCGLNLNTCRLLKEIPSIKNFVQLAAKNGKQVLVFNLLIIDIYIKIQIHVVYECVHEIGQSRLGLNASNFARNRTAAACKTNIYLTGDAGIKMYLRNVGRAVRFQKGENSWTLVFITCCLVPCNKFGHVMTMVSRGVGGWRQFAFWALQYEKF